MGEGTTRVNGDPARQTRTLENEIDHLRTRLDRSLAEVDRRRHEYTDIKLQIRKHPEVLIGAGVVAVLLLGGAGVMIWRAKKRQEPLSKAHRLRVALGRAVDKPEHVAKGQPSVGEKILASVGTTIAVSLTKKLLEYAWQAPKKA